MYEVKRKKKEEQRSKLLKKLEARKTKLKSVQEAQVIKQKLAHEANLDERRNADLHAKEREALKALAYTADTLSPNNLSLAVKAIFEKRHAQEVLTLVDKQHQDRRKAVKQSTVRILERKRVEKVALMESGVKTGDPQLEALEQRFAQDISNAEKGIEEQTKAQQAEAAKKLERDQQGEVEAAVSKLLGARAKVAARRASRSVSSLAASNGGIRVGQNLQSRQEIVRLREQHEEQMAKLAESHQARLQREHGLIQARLDERLNIRIAEMKGMQEMQLDALPKHAEKEKLSLLRQFKQDRQRLVAALKAEKDGQLQKLILRLKRMRNQAKQQLQLSLVKKMEALDPGASTDSTRRSSQMLTLQEQLVRQEHGRAPGDVGVGQASVLAKLAKIEQMLDGSTPVSRAPKAADGRMGERLNTYEGLTQKGLMEAMVDLQTDPLFADEEEEDSKAALLQKSLEAHVDLLEQRQNDTERKLAGLNADAANLTAEIESKEKGKRVGSHLQKAIKTTYLACMHRGRASSRFERQAKTT